MADAQRTQTDNRAETSAGSPLATAVGVFAVVVGFATVAYTVLVTVVDLVTTQLLAYPITATAPFTVITGAILTIPVLAVTTLITRSRLD